MVVGLLISRGLVAFTLGVFALGSVRIALTATQTSTATVAWTVAGVMAVAFAWTLRRGNR